MKIAVDLDEVLADSISQMIPYYNKVYDANLTIADYHTRDFYKIWGCSPEEAIKIVYDFYQTDYFKNIKPISGAPEAIDILKRKNELTVVTSRQYDIDDITRDWLDRYFPNIFSGVYFTNNYSKNGASRKKSEICDQLGVGLIIDDMLEYVRPCLSPDRKAILFDYPWNQTKDLPEDIHRVASWGEALKTIDLII